MFTHFGGAPYKYRIPASLRLQSADSSSLSRTPGTPTDANTWTLSLWIKRLSAGAFMGIIGDSTSGAAPAVGFLTATEMRIWNNYGTYGASYTDASMADTTAHHHLVIASNGSNTYVHWDNTQIIYYASTINLNTSGIALSLGYWNTGYLDALISDVHFVDGQFLAPSNFAKTKSGLWIPKKYTGTYGNNGFHLTFNDGASTTTLGYDRSGNGNNWTLNNFSLPGDWSSDKPT